MCLWFSRCSSHLTGFSLYLISVLTAFYRLKYEEFLSVKLKIRNILVFHINAYWIRPYRCRAGLGNDANEILLISEWNLLFGLRTCRAARRTKGANRRLQNHLKTFIKEQQEVTLLFRRSLRANRLLCFVSVCSGRNLHFRSQLGHLPAEPHGPEGWATASSQAA